MRMRRTMFASATLAFALVAVACSEGSTVGQSPLVTGSTVEPVPAGPVSIQIGDTAVGDILTDGEGSSLYVYLLDDADAIACLADCRVTWSPVLIDGRLSVASGIDKALFDRRELEDGTVQLEVGGQPLYRFSGDTEPGAVNGQASEKLWYLLNPDGTRNTTLTS